MQVSQKRDCQSTEKRFTLEGMIRTKHRQFYLLVYTETDAHVNQYICGGGLDLGLNENGMEEARKISRWFKRNPLKVKRIIASPELRSVQMADILHDEVKVKLVLWRALADQFMGEWEGRPFNQTLDFDHPPRGETEEAFSTRIGAATHELLLMDELCFVVTHLRVARRMLKFFGLGAEPIEPGIVYSVDLPVGEGQGHLRII